MTNQLPNGWLRQQTETVFEQVSTNTKKINTKNCLATGKFPVIDQGQDFIAGFVNDESKVIRSEKPLIIFGDHTRVVKWIDKAFVPGADGTKILITKNFIESRFFYYQLKSINVTDKGYARHFKELKESIFLIPPLAEQKEIATLLDNRLAQVDTLKTRLDAIPNILKRFRQSVLAAAVSGKLTEIEKNWEIVKLKDVATSRLGKMLDKQKNQGEPRLYLRNVNVRWNDFDLSDIFEMRMSDEEAKELIVKKGDILICEGGEPGRCAIWKDDNENYVYQKALHNVRVSERLIPEWLCLTIKDSADSNKLDEYFTGTTIKHFTGKALKEFSFPLPPIEEQTEIVRRVEELFAFADQIEQRVKVAQQRVNHLTQAILAKAFRGEFTAEWREQNPELISGENSAAALLARIQSERKKSAS